MSCSSQTPLSKIRGKITFQNKWFYFEIYELLDGSLVVLSFFGHFIENILAFSIGTVNQVLKDLFEPVELYFLLVDFFVDAWNC